MTAERSSSDVGLVRRQGDGVPGSVLRPSRFPSIPGLDVAVQARVGNKQVGAGGASLDVVEVGGAFAVETAIPGRHRSGMSAHVVGGDFADVFAVGDRYGVAYGDISAKGPEAESFALMASSTLQAIAGTDPAPCSVLGRLNRQLYATAQSRFLLALVFAAYDPVRGRLRLSNCGCWPPVLVSRGRPTVLESRGMMLGISDDLDCEEIDVALEPGDMLVGCTDGISETRRAAQFFGDATFARVLADHAASPAAVVASAIVSAAERFSPDALSDDATVLVLRASGV